MQNKSYASKKEMFRVSGLGFREFMVVGVQGLGSLGFGGV